MHASGASLDTMPVFKPLKTRPMVAGVGVPEFFKILFATLVGIALFFALGGWTHVVSVPTTQAEALAKLSELQSLQGAVSKADKLFASTGATAVTEIDLSAEDAEAYRRAVGLGITADTTRDELLELVPETIEQKQPIIPDVPRGIVFIAVPFFLSLGMLIEYQRSCSLRKDLKRVMKNARKQHVFITQPKKYLKEADHGAR